MRRADRLFQIIQILRRSTRPVTAAALAEELEISKRTVYRDVADLIGQRVPIEGEAGLGYLLAADYDMPPLMLTSDEIEAVMLGAQWVAGRSDKILSNAARDVVAKIAAVVPERLRPFIVEPSVGAKSTIGELEERVDTSMLRSAIRNGVKLRCATGPRLVRKPSVRCGRLSLAMPRRIAC
jgi:predicted DNA-binding transcriptional regulator YafY